MERCHYRRCSRNVKPPLWIVKKISKDGRSDELYRFCSKECMKRWLRSPDGLRDYEEIKRMRDMLFEVAAFMRTLAEDEADELLRRLCRVLDWVMKNR